MVHRKAIEQGLIFLSEIIYMKQDYKKMLLINPNFKILLFPVASLIFLVTVFAILITTGYERINQRISEIDESQKEEAILNEKLSVLSGAQPEVLESSETVVLALPEENSGLLMITQLKKLAADNSVSLSKYSFDAEGKSPSDVESIDIGVNISADDLRSAFSMLFNFENVLPISTMETASISIEDGGIGASIKLLVYSSGLPTQLPALNEPIRKLTQKEEGILAELMTRQKPEFESFEPSGPTERSSPFN
jgi:hypothetical protein